MTRPTTIRGSKLLLQFGDGGTPETFVAPCALATKGFNRTATTNEFNVADCDNPDDPVWVERVKAALSSTISGSGTLAKESLDLYEAAYVDQNPRNMRVTIDYPTGPRTYQGMYLLTTLNLTGEQSGLVQVQIELQSSGPVVPV